MSKGGVRFSFLGSKEGCRIRSSSQSKQQLGGHPTSVKTRVHHARMHGIERGSCAGPALSAETCDQDTTHALVCFEPVQEGSG
jgi:hypothetical protein